MPKAAPDLSEFDAIAPAKLGCWFSRLTEDQQAKVTAAKAAGHSNPTIAKVVTSWGVESTRSPVANHFAGACGCAK